MPQQQFIPYINDHIIKEGLKPLNKYQIEVLTNPDYVDIARKEYRVIELWQKNYIRQYFAVDRATGAVSFISN